jgi:hypothetical protein
MTARDQWIDRHLRRMRLGQFFHRAAEWFAGYLFLFGAVVLAVKLAFPHLWPGVLWLCGGVIVAAWGAWRLARRGQFTRDESIALLDERLNAGGLLMTLSECPHAQWEERLPQAEAQWQEALPRIRPVRFARYLALPLAFAIGSCFVPLREANTQTVTYNSVSRTATRDLESMLENLEEAAVLEEEEKEKLREEIDKLAEETKTTPLTHEKWEIVDHLRETMRVRIDTSALTVSKAQSALTELKRASEGDAGELSEERTLALEKDVLEALKKLGRDGKFSNAPPELRDALQRLTKNREFKLPKDAAARQEMLDQLQEYLDQEAEKLSELRQQCQGGQCKDGNCPHCGRPGDQCKDGNCQGRNGEGRPGGGGVTRGRGDASLSYGDESDKSGTEFKNTVLPPGFLDDPANTVVKETLTAPIVDPAASAPRASRRRLDPASGRETWNRTVRPRHRQVVKRYFQSK